ncbi:transcription antitermination factor NusB [Bombilactobacillus bombi]|uniref:transcription antitermination factor NusB n=1 Tax=Bombilactobacillus bombi TaxID=1303590 RepID=UPI00281156A3|nr:transcription antitermination factor NusB [Bombilactobacillus bombi]MBA1435137.1 transcription antitermination factor NusB [Bombilactobacillus bombi]
MTITRHKVRELAFQTLFLLTSNVVDEQQALQEVLQTAQISETPDYLQFLVQGVWDKHELLDQQLAQHLKKGWTLQRLSRADVNILRIGLFEIQNSPAIPAKVAVNEALELVDQYSDPQAKKFVNGILSNFIPAKNEPIDNVTENGRD